MSGSAPVPPVEVELHDGRRVRLREIRPDDREEMRQAFDRLSSESRYMRFMSHIRQLPAPMLERSVNPQRERGLALVAEIDAPDGIDIVGGARYYILADDETCEFAVAVADGWRGVGLASRLMRELIAVARDRGLHRMEGFVLAGNSGMLTLARRLGFTTEADPHDAALRIVRIELARAATRAAKRSR
jgi:Sortase and related acyltransferases